MLAPEIAKLLHKSTPVVFEAGLYVKRDDLFELEPLASIRGGKLRQCVAMLAGTVSAVSAYETDWPD
jgi:hypothetical protein